MDGDPLVEQARITDKWFFDYKGDLHLILRATRGAAVQVSIGTLDRLAQFDP